jgi:hypothetical protein
VAGHTFAALQAESSSATNATVCCCLPKNKLLVVIACCNISSVVRLTVLADNFDLT